MVFLEMQKSGLIVINRIVLTHSDSFLQRLLSFDAHPRESKHPLPKYRKTKGEGSSTPNLSDCFEFFRQTEKLEKDNSWYCNRCKDHVEATKKIEVYRVPPVLILCLQRFKSHGNYFKEKLEDNIVFPLEGLDLSPHVLSKKDGQGNPVELIYDCIAVSNHYGSLAFGHYTAYGKNYETGKWYDYNDSSVGEVSRDPESEVVSSAAYVIYYVRRDFFPSKLVDYGQVKIQSLTSLPEELAPAQQQPPIMITAGAGALPKQGTVLSQVGFLQGDTSALAPPDYGQGIPIPSYNLENIDNSDEDGAPPGYQAVGNNQGDSDEEMVAGSNQKNRDSTESEPERDD